MHDAWLVRGVTRVGDDAEIGLEVPMTVEPGPAARVLTLDAPAPDEPQEDEGDEEEQEEEKE